MKKSYQVSLVLKKLLKQKKKAGLSSHLNLSIEGKNKSKGLTKKEIEKPKIEKKSNNVLDSKDNQNHEKYQKEIQASQLLKKTTKLKSPGKILKLPKPVKEKLI